MDFHPTPLPDDLLDPTTAQAALEAAMSISLNDEYVAEERARAVELSDRIHEEGASSTEASIVRAAAIAGIVSVLLRGPRDEELKRLTPLPPKRARRRLFWALSVNKTTAPLPEPIVDIARRLLNAIPEERIKELSLSVLTEALEKDLDGDLRKFRRLLQPIELKPAPNGKYLADALHDEFPWMDDVTSAISREIQLADYCGRRFLKLRPVLLVGGAGVGKTRYVQRLSTLCEVPFRLINAAGSADSMSLRGTSKGWSSSRPSSIVQLMLQTLVANPFVLIDEVCKASDSDQNGSLRAVLLTMLEPETARRWFDEGLDTGKVDLSNVNFFATANSLETLSKPLLDRFSIVMVRPPAKSHYPRIIRSVLHDIATEFDLVDARMLPLLDAEDEVRLTESCGNVRQLARAVRDLVQDKVSNEHRPTKVQ